MSFNLFGKPKVQPAGVHKSGGGGPAAAATVSGGKPPISPQKPATATATTAGAGASPIKAAAAPATAVGAANRTATSTGNGGGGGGGGAAPQTLSALLAENPSRDLGISEDILKEIVAKEHCARILMSLRSKNQITERDVNSVSKHVMSDSKILGEFQELIYQKSNDTTLEQWIKVKLGQLWMKGTFSPFLDRPLSTRAQRVAATAATRSDTKTDSKSESATPASATATATAAGTSGGATGSPASSSPANTPRGSTVSGVNVSGGGFVGRQRTSSISSLSSIDTSAPHQLSKSQEEYAQSLIGRDAPPANLWAARRHSSTATTIAGGGGGGGDSDTASVTSGGHHSVDSRNESALAAAVNGGSGGTDPFFSANGRSAPTSPVPAPTTAPVVLSPPQPAAAASSPGGAPSATASALSPAQQQLKAAQQITAAAAQQRELLAQTSAALAESKRYFTASELVKQSIHPNERIAFRRTFFLNYRRLISASNVLELYLSYYLQPPVWSGPTAGTATDDGATRMTCQLKISANLIYWFKHHPNDFSPHMRQTLRAFIASSPPDAHGMPLLTKHFNRAEQQLRSANTNVSGAAQADAAAPAIQQTKSPRLNPISEPSAAAAIPPLIAPSAATATATTTTVATATATAPSASSGLSGLRSVASSASISSLASNASDDSLAGGYSASFGSVVAAANATPVAAPVIPTAGSSAPLPIRCGVQLLKVGSADLARELTCMEMDAFTRIDALELTDQNWQRPDHHVPAALKGTAAAGAGAAAASGSATAAMATATVSVPRAPNLRSFISRFNAMTYWVASEIIEQETVERRAHMLFHWIDVADECLRLFHNFSAVFTIVAAISLAPLYRLKELRDSLDSNARYRARLEKLQALCSPSDNYAAYRPLIRQCIEQSIPCVPHMAVVCKDLFLLEELTPHERQKSVVDWRRLQRITTEIDALLTCSRACAQVMASWPHLQPAGVSVAAIPSVAGAARPNPILHGLLVKEFRCTRADDYLLERSLAVEPKITWVQYRQKKAISVLLEEGFL